MEQDYSQLNNIHGSESGFINNGYYPYLQQPTYANEISSMSDNTLPDNKNHLVTSSMTDEHVNSTTSSNGTQYNVRVNNELDNNQQQYMTTSATAASAYSAPQCNSYQDSPQFIPNAPTRNVRVNNNQQQYMTSSATSEYTAASTYSAPQCNSYQDSPQFISNVTPAPQLTLQINSPTIIYESLDYRIILISKRPLVDSNSQAQ